MKVALVYDRVNKIGGAERVITALHQVFPDAPLYTAVYNRSTARWADGLKVIPSFLNAIPFARTHHEWLPLLTPYAFESFDLSAYDVIISITSADAKAVITSPKQLHLCYLLTPTRYLWSHQHEYAGKGLKKRIADPLIKRLQQWDIVAASRPDEYIAISNYVKDRCRTYYHRDPAAVIYPPVQTSYFSTHPNTCRHPQQSYYLTVTRLVPYKKTELAIEACNRLGEHLVIVGTGTEMNRLKRLAGPTITFTGHVDDESLRCLYHHAKALIFPQEEEFGITAVEAQAAGLPVIAYNQGASSEIVISGKTGILFESQTVACLQQALATFNHHTWYDKTIQEHAHKFSEMMFQKRIKAYTEDLWQKKQHLE